MALREVRIGVIGTSWWVDAMYLPALDSLDGARVVALAGRNPERASVRAGSWGIPGVYTDWRRMIDAEDLDGVIVAAANPVHYPATHMALERGLHVLCEKPLAGSYEQAAELVRLADVAGVRTMVPFTYAYMPGFRWLTELVDSGFVGRLHHVGLRYHTGYGLTDGYQWKFDERHNPSGALGDIGSHFVYLALRLGGAVTAITARLDVVGRHPPVDPDGVPYPVAADTSTAIVEFESGAQGLIFASAIAHEGTAMDQRHEIEVHGSEGTLRYLCDWLDTQVVTGARVGEGPSLVLPIPDRLWSGVRRGPVHDTYRDVFRMTDAMARGWVRAIQAGTIVRPDLRDGAEVQRVLDAAVRSSDRGRRVRIESEWSAPPSIVVSPDSDGA